MYIIHMYSSTCVYEYVWIHRHIFFDLVVCVCIHTHTHINPTYRCICPLELTYVYPQISIWIHTQIHIHVHMHMCSFLSCSFLRWTGTLTLSFHTLASHIPPYTHTHTKTHTKAQTQAHTYTLTLSFTHTNLVFHPTQALIKTYQSYVWYIWHIHTHSLYTHTHSYFAPHKPSLKRINPMYDIFDTFTLTHVLWVGQILIMARNYVPRKKMFSNSDW